MALFEECHRCHRHFLRRVGWIYMGWQHQIEFGDRSFTVLELALATRFGIITPKPEKRATDSPP